MALEAEALGQRHRAADLGPALRRRGEPQRADLPPVDRLPGLLLRADRTRRPSSASAASGCACRGAGRPAPPHARCEPWVSCAFSSSSTSRSPFAASAQATAAADRAAADDDDAGVAVEQRSSAARPPGRSNAEAFREGRSCRDAPSRNSLAVNFDLPSRGRLGVAFSVAAHCDHAFTRAFVGS